MASNEIEIHFKLCHLEKTLIYLKQKLGLKPASPIGSLVRLNPKLLK